MRVCPTELASKVNINEDVLQKARRVAERTSTTYEGHSAAGMKLVDNLVAADDKSAAEFGAIIDQGLVISLAQDRIEVLEFFQQLLALTVQWAKLIPQFQNLPTVEDQVCSFFALRNQ